MPENDATFEYGEEETPHSMSLEEIEQRNSQPAAQDFTKIKLEGDGVPEILRGKSVADLVAGYDTTIKALRASEEQRQALSNSQAALSEVRNRGASQQQAAPAPVPEPEMTTEQWKQLFEDDPFTYHEKKAELLERKTSRILQESIAPLAGSAADQSLTLARSKYVDEFAALGQEIDQTISSLADKRALSAPGAMDELIAYVRGKNFDKFYNYKLSKGGESLDDARREAASVAPRDASVITQPRRQSNSRSRQMGDLEKQVAQALGVSEEDYAKHM
jgi:hypothetical protein